MNHSIAVRRAFCTAAALLFCVLVLMVPRAAHATASPLQACAAGKEKAAANFAKCTHACDSAGLRMGLPPTAACLSTCRARLAASWQKAVAKGGCAVADDEVAMTQKLEAFAQRLRNMLGESFGGPSPCTVQEYRVASLLQSCRLLCFAKPLKKSTPLILDTACLAKCAAKFDANCPRAQAKGSCLSNVPCGFVKTAIETSSQEFSEVLNVERTPNVCCPHDALYCDAGGGLTAAGCIGAGRVPSGASTACDRSGACVAAADAQPGVVCTHGSSCTQNLDPETCVTYFGVPEPRATCRPEGGPLVQGDPIFVTYQQYTGNLGGLAGADAKCALEAQLFRFTGTFQAWLSDSTTSAASRLPHSSQPYVLWDGTIVADDWSDLTDGTLDHSINLSAAGDVGPADVWTATNPAGSSVTSASCEDWSTTFSFSLPLTGATTVTDYRWTTNVLALPCSTAQRLFCLRTVR